MYLKLYVVLAELLVLYRDAPYEDVGCRQAGASYFFFYTH
jgi:hypothetical protein